MKPLKTISATLMITLGGVFSSIGAQLMEVPMRGPIPFASFDQDGSGTVSQQEFETAHAERKDERYAQGLPMGGTGSVPTFQFLDGDGDGQLTMDELAAGQKAHRAMNQGMGPGGGPGKGGGRGSMPVFSDCDVDGDGKLTEAEFNQARAMRIAKRTEQGYLMKNIANAPSFADIDGNGDGVVDAGEFSAHQARHSQQRRQSFNQ